MNPTLRGAAGLFQAVGLRPDGPAVLGRPIRASGPGVYVIELPDPPPTAPIELARIGKWIEGLPDLRLDGVRPTSKALAARLASFWLPSQAVLFIGSSSTSVAGRVAALERHVLGERRPHAASQWLKALSADAFRVWWADTDAPEEWEGAFLGAFAEGAPANERGALDDPDLVLPFANLRSPTGAVKRHGITGSFAAAEPGEVAAATRIKSLPPGDADGVSTKRTRTGTVRATRATPAPRTPVRRAPPVTRPVAPPIEVSAEGLARLQSERAELVGQRPGVVSRIRAAKELGDLKENSDYAAAREEQSFLEGRIQMLDGRLREAVVVGAPADTTRVRLGSRVSLDAAGDETSLTLVGQTESDAAAGRISSASPVGRALLGKSVGDEVVVRTPGGEVRYRVLAID